MKYRHIILTYSIYVIFAESTFFFLYSVCVCQRDDIFVFYLMLFRKRWRPCNFMIDDTQFRLVIFFIQIYNNKKKTVAKMQQYLVPMTFSAPSWHANKISLIFFAVCFKSYSLLVYIFFLF